MKKILLGLLIVGALSACTSSKEKETSMEISTKVQTLNETVEVQTQEYEYLKAETEELKMQVEELKMQTQE